MKQVSETANLIYIMRHFSCDEPMARLIVKSYKANNNYEAIERFCEEERTIENGNPQLH